MPSSFWSPVDTGVQEQRTEAWWVNSVDVALVPEDREPAPGIVINTWKALFMSQSPSLAGNYKRV